MASQQTVSEIKTGQVAHPLVVELPDDPGGATGAKYFHVFVVGKENTITNPYNVVNEKIASELARAVGLRAPEILLYKYQLGELPSVWRSFSHYLPHSTSGESAPGATARMKERYFLNHPGEMEGMVCFDLFICNNDRRRKNGGNLIGDNHDGKIWMIDHANALFYRLRKDVNILPGIPRLKSVEENLEALFDKPYEYLDELKSWEIIDIWCDRIQSIPDHFIERTIQNLPDGLLDANESDYLVEFLNRRKKYMRSIIEENIQLFSSLNPRFSLDSSSNL